MFLVEKLIKEMSFYVGKSENELKEIYEKEGIEGLKKIWKNYKIDDNGPDKMGVYRYYSGIGKIELLFEIIENEERIVSDYLIKERDRYLEKKREYEDNKTKEELKEDIEVQDNFKNWIFEEFVN